MDMLIAARAMAEDLILVTNNIGEFNRVEDLQLENWLEYIEQWRNRRERRAYTQRVADKAA